MPYPWPSYGGFRFKRDENAIWGTDNGWALAPNYNRQRPLGSASDVITTLSIGSAERTFECYLTIERFNALQGLLNTKALFTDWARPTPDSRQAFLSEVTPVEESFGIKPDGLVKRKRRVRITFVSA